MRIAPLRLPLVHLALVVFHLLGHLFPPASSTSSASSSGSYPDCDGIVLFIGDGDCDTDNNNESCGYDGGDCCSCTCSDTVDYTCGDGGYDCQDPAVPSACVNQSAYYMSPDYYDMSSLTLEQYAECLEDGGYLPSIGDGLCDYSNNNASCGYDLGDCCICTCRDSADYTCGSGPAWYNCVDPDVPQACVDESNTYEYDDHYWWWYYYDDDYYSQYANCSKAGGYIWNIGNNYCNSYNNIEECDYDGGDCCSCTCDNSTSSSTSSSFNVTSDSTYDDSYYSYYYGYDCGVVGYDCVDPTVSEACVNDSEAFENPYTSTWYDDYYYHYAEYENCSLAGGLIYWIDDNWCDLINNIEECDYDGGDCCSCTCENSTSSSSSTFSTSSSNSSFSNSSSDHSYYNYYGGVQCGIVGYSCVDPTVPESCVNESDSFSQPYYWYYSDYGDYGEYSDCSEAGGSVWSIGNGYCDVTNNVEVCDYDGGDCCPCTCEESGFYGNSCGVAGYYCVDPEAPCPKNSTDVPYTGEYVECSASGGDVAFISDGDCDSFNNQESCGYDGGDCCISTCVDTEEYTCGSNGGFDCQDPGGS